MQKPLRKLQDYLIVQKDNTATALIIEQKSYSFKKLYDNSKSLAQVFKNNGLSRNNAVAIFADNTYECICSIYAALLADAHFLLINPLTKANKLAYILEDSGAKILCTDGHLNKQITPNLELLNKLSTVILSGNSVEGLKHIKFEDCIQQIDSSPISNEGISLDLASLIYTSGSTGSPKGVMLTHQAMCFTLESLNEYLRLDEKQRIFSCLPLAFDYGLYQLFMAVKLAVPFILERSFAFPALVLQRITDFEATVFPGVPTMFATLIKMYREKPFTLPNILRVTNTAAALQPDHINVLKLIFPNALIFSMYGLTECKRVSYLEPEELEQFPQSVGRAIPGTEVYILDDNLKPCAPMETGQLYVRGPHIMKGYLNLPSQTNEMLKDNIIPGETILSAQDLFKQDSDGRLYFQGRNDDIIKARGEKVSPVEVESVLYSIEDVVEAAVIGVDDPIEGQSIKAFVVLKDNSTFDIRQVKRYCTLNLENFMVPKEIVLLASLPKTNTGKVNKKELSQ